MPDAKLPSLRLKRTTPPRVVGGQLLEIKMKRAAGGLLEGLSPFLETSLKDDIQAISEFFGIEPTSQAMSKLVGLSPASLSRALSDNQSTRAAGHIAVLAALSMEARKYFESDGSSRRRIDRAAVNRWLYSGRLRTEHGYLAPIEALSDPKTAQAELSEVRRTRFG